ncbi:TRAP transporter large permease [uncultured Dysosmobacter sp.]|uniref:TRAP transporter large permease n=1 Tax=uncultured Dysosmobacter sp. TaxID=2591384 RepID=UPI00261C95B5|nr:TRAP transporter large permease [uncultured Dysosmobacter sp.]
MIATLFVVLAILIVVGAPIAVCIGAAPMMSMVVGGQAEQLFLAAQRMVTALDSTVLIAIPMFVLAGVIMGKGGISQQIVNVCYELLGWMPGSLGVVTVVACMFFAAISGSAPATVAAIGGILIPQMIDDGYPAGFAAALAASGGIIGCIIPPSIPFVNYALITGCSVSELFAAGVLPGVLMGVALIIIDVYCAAKYGWGSRNKGINLGRLWRAFRSAIWALLMPVIILGGIYSGLFTPTEAAAVAAMYGFLASVFIYKGVKMSEMMDLAFEAVKTTASIMFIVATANIFAYVVTRQQVPAKLSNMVLSVTDNLFIILLVINIILLINGCFMETTASTYIYTPIFYPLVAALGYDAIQFGVVMVMNLTMGLITPPLGINLFVATGVDKRVVFAEQVKRVIPMFIALVVVLMLVTYIPDISLLLVRMMRA